MASKVGYQNEKYFSKIFKKRTGTCPKEYRQK
ncbi:helix-turn-helix domain-containing protein [Gracilibacillus boraciitolerans]|nr:AraC family transcriptional regulator [Gracilibacillus boraciitolerans]